MKKLTPAALNFAAQFLYRERYPGAPEGGPVVDSGRREVEQLAQAAAAWEMGEAFDRYVGRRATLTRDVRLGDPGAFLVAGAEVRVVGIVDDETLTVEPADLPGDSVAVSLYDLAFEPEAPAPDLADADSLAAKYFPDLTLAPAPRAADGSFGLPGSPPEAAPAPQERETASTATVGQVSFETPRHGPQTSAQAIAEALDSADLLPSMETLRVRAEAWYGVCRALDDVDLEWTDRATTGGDAAVASIRWLGGADHVARLRHEIDVLRRYHSRDTLAQADEALERERANAWPPAEPSGTTEPHGSGCGVDGCDICNPPYIGG